MARVNVELKARDPDPEATRGALPRPRRRRRAACSQTRHVLRGARADGSSSGSTARALGGELIAYRRPDAPRRSESRYVLAPVVGAGRACGGAGRGARHGRGRVEAPAAVPVGGGADPPRRGRGAGELCGVRGGAARRRRPCHGAATRSPGCARAGDLRRRARVGRVRGPADGRSSGAAPRRAERRCATPTRRIRSSRSAPRCAGGAARSMPARTSRTWPTPRGSARRPRRSARWWRPARPRSPRSRWSPSASRIARRAAAAGSGCPSSAAPRRPVYLGARRDPGRRRWASCLPGAFDREALEREPGLAARRRRARVGPGRGGRRRRGPGRGRLRGAARLSAADRRGPFWAGRAGSRSAASRSRCSRVARTCTRAAHLDALRAPVRALRAAGASVLVLTNAAGSLRPEVGPGSLMAITDHINMTGVNLLAGPNDVVDRSAVPLARGTPTTLTLLVHAARLGRRASGLPRRGRVPRGHGAELRDAGRDPRLPRDGRATRSGCRPSRRRSSPATAGCASPPCR